MNSRITPFLVALFALLNVWQCQQPAPTASAPTPEGDAALLLLQGDSLRKEKDYEQAIARYEQALPILRAYPDSLTAWMKTRRNIAVIMSGEQYKRLEALTYIQATHDALSQWRPPATDAEYEEQTKLYLREYFINKQVTRFDRAQQAIEQAERIFRAHLYGKAHRIAAYLFAERANTYVQAGEFAAAEQLFQESLAYEQQYEAPGLASFNDYGSSYLSQENYERALAIFQAGLQRPMTDTFDYTLLLLNQAEAEAHMKQTAEAQASNAAAARLLKYEEAYGTSQYNRCMRGYWENEGIIAVQNGQWKRAANNFKEAGSELWATGRTAREAAGFIVAEAAALYAAADVPKALERYHAAWLQFYPGWSEPAAQPPSSNVLLTDKVLVEILEGKARCLARLQQFDAALEFYALIPVVEAQLRAVHTLESSSLAALQKSRHRFDAAVQLAWEAYTLTSEQKFAEKAYFFTEMARSTLQTQELRRNEAQDLLSPADQEADRALAERIAAAEIRLSDVKSPEDPVIQQLVRDIRQLKEEQVRFRRAAAQRNPNYAIATGNTRLVAPDSVRHLLRHDQLMLNYYMTDSALFVLSFAPSGGFSWRREVWTPADKTALDSLIQYLESPDPERKGHAFYARFSSYFWQKLAAPNVSGHNISGLVIVPDLALAALPFEALLTDAPAENSSAKGLPYAIKKYALSYAFSATLLHTQQSITHKRAHQQRLALAAFAPAYRNAALRLDSAASDARFAARLYGGTPYTDEAATEARFREAAGQARILLLAMHGASDHVQMNRCHLLFGDQPQNAGGDNVLYSNELKAIPAKADLAVISACFGGDGPVQKGEGTYSIARAFTIAGVPSTIMSLWRLPVVSSSPLVRDFLQELQANGGQKSKDVALQQAKLRWIDEQGASSKSHPYYWAGLVAAGDCSALPVSENHWITPILWLLAAALAAVAILRLKRRKKTGV